MSGSALALKGHRAATAVYTVEPAGFDDHARSLGPPVNLSATCRGARSICDALQAPTPGEITFPINRALLTGGLVVTDDEVREAMRFAFNVLKLVVEPGGAVALAAVLQRRVNTIGLVTALPLSGGNVDPAQFADFLSPSRGSHG